MSLRNFSAIAFGLAILAPLSGCCTSGSCGSAATAPATVPTLASTSAPVYSAPVYSAPVFTQAAPADCGCGCSASSPMESYSEPVYSDTFVSETGDVNELTTSNDVPTAAGSGSRVNLDTSSVTPVVEPPTGGGTPGFSAKPAVKVDTPSLPGNLLPEN